MSRENEEVLPLRAVWRAIGRLDADACVALCDPNVIFESRITAVESRAYEGHDGVRRYISNLAEAFDRIEVEPFDVVQDRDRAAFTNRFRGHGRGSGVEVEQRYFVAMQARRGKLLWRRFFDARSEALEAVGLRE